MQKNIKIWLSKYKRFRFLFFTYLIILTWLLLRPSGKDDIDSFINNLSRFYNDKVIHALTFFLLAALSFLSFPRTKVVYIIISCIVYGFLIELLQEYMAMGRTFEVNDILADFIGCLMGGLMIRMVGVNKKDSI